MSDALAAVLDYLGRGGLVMVPLVGITFVLWYAIGYRFAVLRRGHAGPVRALLTAGVERPRGVIGEAVAAAVALRPGPVAKLRLEEALGPLGEHLGRCSTLARSIVVVAPLLGLLGTVTGMIELFDALGTQTLDSADGGIAGGIAEALFTTQMGLAIAIPGYFATRLLDRREERLRDELQQVKDVALQRQARTA